MQVCNIQTLFYLSCRVFVNTGTDFLGGVRGGAHPPRNDLHPPPKVFGTPTNYIYFDLIVSYLIILTTKFVKLPILWSQILACRPRKQIFLNYENPSLEYNIGVPARGGGVVAPPPPNFDKKYSAYSLA